MGKGSRGRPGRKRDFTKRRDKSQKPLSPTTREARETRTHIKATPEIEAMKARIGGLEVNDPLAHLDLTHDQRKALDDYFKIRVLAGWGVQAGKSPLASRHVGDYDYESEAPVDRLKHDPIIPCDDEYRRDRDRQERLRRMDAVLIAASPAAHRAVLYAFSQRGTTNRIQKTQALLLGADALVAFFRHGQRRAA